MRYTELNESEMSPEYLKGISILRDYRKAVRRQFFRRQALFKKLMRMLSTSQRKTICGRKAMAERHSLTKAGIDHAGNEIGADIPTDGISALSDLAEQHQAAQCATQESRAKDEATLEIKTSQGPTKVLSYRLGNSDFKG